MRTHSVSLSRIARNCSPRALITVLALGLLLVAAQDASAQCFANPTGETSVGLKNASSYYLTFYIDGVRKDGVPSGDRSVDFPVTPGEHTLRADAVVGGETVSTSRTVMITSGGVCTWTVTNPPEKAGGGRVKPQLVTGGTAIIAQKPTQPDEPEHGTKVTKDS